MSIRELRKLLTFALNFDFLTPPMQIADIGSLYDIRNLVTHSYGVADRVFVSRNPMFRLEEGQQLSSARSSFRPLSRPSFQLARLRVLEVRVGS